MSTKEISTQRSFSSDRFYCGDHHFQLNSHRITVSRYSLCYRFVILCYLHVETNDKKKLKLTVWFFLECSACMAFLFERCCHLSYLPFSSRMSSICSRQLQIHIQIDWFYLRISTGRKLSWKVHQDKMCRSSTKNDFFSLSKKRFFFETQCSYLLLFHWMRHQFLNIYQ